MQVRIPAGVTDSQKIRIKGKGSAGENGGPAGDLYVLVHVRPHPVFGRNGDNLTITAPVTFAEAALGADIEVPTLQGQRVKLRLAPGTPNGRTLRVRGKGVHRGNGTSGDLLVTVEVQVPAQLDPAAAEALKQYDAVVGHAGAITPVPGGVGPMTIACLLENTVRAAWRRAGLPKGELTI